MNEDIEVALYNIVPDAKFKELKKEILSLAKREFNDEINRKLLHIYAA